jgi:SLT domain-containing protein
VQRRNSPLGGLEEGNVRGQAEVGAHLAIPVYVPSAAGARSSAAARGGRVEDEIAGEAEQREEELVQHHGGGVSLGFARDREERGQRVRVHKFRGGEK